MINFVNRNINTLEYPLWIPSRIISKKIELRSNKYIIKTGMGLNLPTAKDIDILMSLMSKDKQKLEFISIYELMKFLGYSCNGKEYERVKNSLDIWQATFITFRNKAFYLYGNKRTSIGDLSILTYKNVYPEEPVEIEFTSYFYDIHRDKYSLNIPLDVFKTIRNPYSKRLFELIYKINPNDVESTTSVSVENIIKKFPFRRDIKPSEVISIIKKGIKDINNAFEKYNSKRVAEFNFSWNENSRNGIIYLNQERRID